MSKLEILWVFSRILERMILIIWKESSWLSRNLDFFKHTESVIHKALQAARSNLALVIAVNDLRDEENWCELMAKWDLDWNELCNVLPSRSSARESMVKLKTPVNEIFSKKSIKSEVAAVRKNKQNSRNPIGDCCYGSDSHKQ